MSSAKNSLLLQNNETKYIDIVVDGSGKEIPDQIITNFKNGEGKLISKRYQMVIGSDRVVSFKELGIDGKLVNDLLINQ